MYIDLITFIILLIIVLVLFKRFSSFVFFMAIVDIFLRILAFIKNNIGLRDVAAVIGKYLPESVIDIIEKYTGSVPIICLLLKWCFCFIMIVFLVYITEIFIHKKKI